MKKPSELAKELMQPLTQQSLSGTPTSIKDGDVLKSQPHAYNAPSSNGSSAISSPVVLPNSLDLARYLSAHPLFAQASPQFLDDLISKMTIRYFAHGDYIIRQDDIGKAMFLLLKGHVAVISKDGESAFAKLGPGSFFGEIGLLMDCPRTASIIARSRCLVAILTSRVLSEIIEQYPRIGAEIRKEAEARLAALKSRSNGPVSSSEEDHFSRSSSRASIAIEPPLSPYIGSPKRSRRPSASGNMLQNSTEEKPAVPPPPVPEMNTLAKRRSNASTEKLSINPPSFLATSNEISNSSPSPVTQSMHSIFFELSNLVALDDDRGRNRSRSFLNLAGESEVEPALSALDESLTMKRNLEKTNRRSSSLSRLNMFDEDPQRSETMTEQTGTEPQFKIQVDSCESASVSETKSDSSSIVGDMLPALGPARHPNLYDPKRRRASVAVWSDPKLSAIAQQKTESLAAKSSRRFEEQLEVCESVESIADNVEVDENAYHKEKQILKIPNVVRRIAKYLPFRDLWQLSQTTKLAHDAVRHKDCLSFIDLNKYYRSADDTLLVKISEYAGSHLDTLILKQCWRVTDTSLSSLAHKCPNLRIIDLGGCWDLSDNGLVALTMCKNLQSIDVGNCRKVTDAGILALTENCSMLKDVFLSYAKPLTDSAMISFERSSQLRRLNLQRCLGITDHSFFLLAEKSFRWFKLQELVLSDCSFLSDTAVISMVKVAPNLKQLNLSFCCALTEQSVSALAGCIRLRALDLSFCGNAVSDHSLSTLLKECISLERLSLRGCIRVNENTLDILVNLGMNLSVLNISSCKYITADIIKAKIPSEWKLLNSQSGVLDNLSITGGDAYGSGHLRRGTA